MFEAIRYALCMFLEKHPEFYEEIQSYLDDFTQTEGEEENGEM